MLTIKATYLVDEFYEKLIDLTSQYQEVTCTEGYDMTYTDTMKKGWAKVKSAFASKENPFVGIWEDGTPIKGFYAEDGSCTFENIKNWLDDYKRKNTTEDRQKDTPVNEN